mgnify:CR=1 FL=1
MPCNPSIGGIGKGIVVREVDALGGAMAIATDKSSIHRKILNRSKGPAVWGPRHQIDRDLYQQYMAEFITNQPNIDVVESVVDKILTDDVCSVNHDIVPENRSMDCDQAVYQKMQNKVTASSVLLNTKEVIDAK